jgi:V8-like Glu-specific endopeptidase
MKRSVVSILTALLIFSMSTPGLAQESAGLDAAAGAGPKVVESIKITPAQQRAALDFWTREVTAAAQPMQIILDASAASVDVAAKSQPQAAEPMGQVASGAPAADADAVAQAAFPDEWAALAASSEGQPVDEPTGTSQVFDSYTVNQASALWQIYPHKWIGRLSFTTPGGTSYCSGTSISGNVMLTAAHCIYDTTNNQFYSNWVFRPAYRNGTSPYGAFAATTCWVLTAWVNLSGSFAINTWSRHDVGVCKMGNNAAGQTLNNAVGWMGRQWNQPYIRHFFNMGYPFNDYNNNPLANAGLYLRTCVAESFQQTTETRGMGCNYGPGISGGPWIAGYKISLVAGYADGVNSGLFVGTRNLYGPRFNSNNIVPLCTAATC